MATRSIPSIRSPGDYQDSLLVCAIPSPLVQTRPMVVACFRLPQPKRQRGGLPNGKRNHKARRSQAGGGGHTGWELCMHWSGLVAWGQSQLPWGLLQFSVFAGFAGKIKPKEKERPAPQSKLGQVKVHGQNLRVPIRPLDYLT